VIGWALDRHLEDDLTIAALEMAFRRRTPPQGLTHHSDRGVQYASNAADPPQANAQEFLDAG
jgi:transposase InsO family protein